MPKKFAKQNNCSPHDSLKAIMRPLASLGYSLHDFIQVYHENKGLIYDEAKSFECFGWDLYAVEKPIYCSGFLQYSFQLGNDSQLIGNPTHSNKLTFKDDGVKLIYQQSNFLLYASNYLFHSRL
ncbi:MAG TPA: hypothetical protein VJS91_10815 [Nitrososphaeraceae archaeon]|nr:hypothetical protein [Nitrososphaeraceae archaeon]